MFFIAHRGKVEKKDSGNSRKCLYKALELPYVDGIEFDVRITKDKKTVIMHDPVIDFVSNGSGIVKYMTIDELRKYQYSDNEPILLLEELLDNIHSNKLILIELKGLDHDFELVEVVNKIIQNYTHLNIVIISFNYSLLKYFEKINKSIPLGILIGYSINHKYRYNSFDYNLFAYHYLEYIYMNKKLIYFNINKKEQLKEIKNKREDIFIITDYSKNLSSH